MPTTIITLQDILNTNSFSGSPILNQIKGEDAEDDKKLLAAIALSCIHHCLTKSRNNLNSHGAASRKKESPFSVFDEKENIFSNKELFALGQDAMSIKKYKPNLKKDENDNIYIEIDEEISKDPINKVTKDLLIKLKNATKNKNLAQKLTGFAISNAMLDCRNPEDKGIGVFGKEATVKYKIDDNGRDANGEEIKEQESAQASQKNHNPSYANIEAYVNRAKEYSDSKDEILKKVKSFTESFHEDPSGKLTAQGHAFNLIITLIAAKNQGLSSQPGKLEEDIRKLLEKEEVKKALGVPESDSKDEATILALKEIACETSVRFKEIIERVKFINPPKDDYSKSATNPDRLCHNAELIIKSQKEEIGKLNHNQVNDLRNLLGYLKGDSSRPNILNIDDKLKKQLKEITIATPPPSHPPPDPPAPPAPPAPPTPSEPEKISFATFKTVINKDDKTPEEIEKLIKYVQKNKAKTNQFLGKNKYKGASTIEELVNVLRENKSPARASTSKAPTIGTPVIDDKKKTVK